MIHRCHFPNCRTPVEPKLWGCKKHWYMLPQWLRNNINRAYVPGQEVTKTPSPEYIAAARTAREWILGHLGGEVARLAALNKQASAQEGLAL